MGSLGLTLTVQQPTTRPSILTNKYSHQNHYHIKSLEYKLSRSKFIKLNTNKVGNFCIIKASSEGSSMSTTTTEKLGVKVERNPSDSRLSELGVLQWPKWGCPPSRFPWTYDAKETCYLLQGKVKVYPAGSTEAVEIGAGDLVVFPKGMSCTWDVSEAVDKHYKFE